MSVERLTGRRAPANDDEVDDDGASNLSKVTPPTAHRVHPSKRLFARLDGLAEQIIWIHGPPGSGKTTLAASYLAAKAIEPLWYRLDEADADPATLFHFLGGAWRGRRAGLRLPSLTPGAILPLFARRFFRTLFACPRTKVLVFDDYHEVAANSSAHSCIAAGLEELPRGCRVIVISRTPPPPALARLRINRLIEVIEPDALRMTLDEAEGLVRQRGADLATARVEKMLRQAEGWTAGLILMIEAGGDVASDVSDVLFDYFAGEIFQRMSLEHQSLLCTIALMPVMSTASAERLTGSSEAVRLLEDLRRRNYFTTRDDGTPAQYRFHALFRDFLIACARDRLTAGELTAARVRAAAALQESGNPDAAVGLLEDAGALEALADLIKCQAGVLLNEGRNATLIGWLEKLPRPLFDEDPWLNHWAGVASIYFATDRAIACQRRAAQLFEADGDLAGVYLAWAAEVDAVRSDAYGDMARLDGLVDRLHALVTRHPEVPAGAGILRVAIAAALALSRRSSDRQEIALWRDRALTAARELPGEHWSAKLGYLFAIPALHDADYVAARRYLGDRPDVALNTAQAVEMSAYIAPTMMLLYRQAAGDCAAFVEIALQAMESAGNLVWANTLSGMAANDLFRRGGDPAAARAWMNRMGDYDDRYGTGRGSYYYIVAAHVELMVGDMPLARRHADRAVELAIAQGWHFYTGTARLALTAVSIEQGDLSGATAELVELDRLMAASATRILAVTTRLFKADVAFAMGDEAAGAAELEAAFALARQQGDLSVGCAAATTGRLCAKALALGIERDTVRAFIRASGVPAPDGCDDAWPWPLAIRTFGGFDVMKDGAPLVFTRKTPKRLILLLKAIAAYGGRDVPEAKLIDAVWPDDEADAANNSLRTAIHRLRKLFGDTGVITMKAGRVGLEPGRCWLDLWSFEQHVARRRPGETEDVYRARRHRAKGLYRGDFLADDEDLWWAIERRERCRKAMEQLDTA